jgi:hypothetical protein
MFWLWAGDQPLPLIERGFSFPNFKLQDSS